MTLELFDRRVRGPLDITQALEIPVIGVLPAPKLLASMKTRRFRLGLSRTKTA